jgi:hypothetical protein
MDKNLNVDAAAFPKAPRNCVSVVHRLHTLNLKEVRP